MKRSRNVAEMRRPYEGACIIRKQSSKPQAKKPRKTTPRMQAHALDIPNMESSAHETMSDASKARYPPKKAGSQRRQNEGGYAIKHRTAKAALPQRPQAGSAALQAKSAIRLAAITVNQKAGLRRFATSRLSCISSKLERTRRSAQPPRPRARRRWRPTASRRWREASLPQSPLSDRACPRQPAQASR